MEEFNIHNLRKKVLEGHTRSQTWRRLQLNRIKDLLQHGEEQIIQSLAKDLKKPSTEAFFEILALKQELQLAERNLSTWMQPKRIKVPVWLQPGAASVIAEPLGCVLIIGPWNYPFMLTLQPLISALAAGNTAILKPSEFAPSTSMLIEKLIQEFFPNDVVKVLQGDSEFAASLLEHKFDHIFFTGGSNIAKKVMKAASKHLTPVTLELGGKNPALVMKGANLDITAKRIVWGKIINSGQTCLAPNHLLVQEELNDKLISKLTSKINEFYGEEPEKSCDIGKLNNRQFEKIVNLIKNANAENKLIHGGKINYTDKKISPALVRADSINDPIMSDELFGPILPIITIENIESALSIINNQEKSLAIYMFGGSEKDQQTIINSTSSGGICFNDVIIQAGIPELPFGGVGLSGTGHYHGKSGFDTFSHLKSVLKRPFWLDLNFRYPPYKLDISLINKLIQ